MTTPPLTSLTQATTFFLETLARHPERDMEAAHDSIRAGRPRRYPVIYLNHLNTPDDTFVPTDEERFPDVKMAAGPEADLAREIVGLLEPLKMLNPVSRAIPLGVGPGSLCPSFGLELKPDCQWTPAESRTLDEVAALHPDPAASGLLPAMREKIERIKALTPPEFKIHLPDRQGPFNLAHLILGNEAFVAPLVEPEKFHQAMQNITDFWIAVRRTLLGWIGPDRLSRSVWSDNIICECSCNMISPDLYREHVLPFDLQIAKALGRVAIHPCSGPHVFRMTLENIPGIEYTEAGSIEKTAAGAITVPDALKEIAGRPIALGIGQEPPPGGEYESIRADLDRYPAHPRLNFNYTGMHWRKKDRPLIRDIHRRLDAYWAEKILPQLKLG